jgi:hypothetical protein
VIRNPAMNVPALVMLLSAMAIVACGPPTPLADPASVLSDPSANSRRQMQAMYQLDATPGTEGHVAALRRPIALPAYGLEVRKAAFERLHELDPDALADQLALSLPRDPSRPWREWACRRIGELRWQAPTATLIRCWAVPLPAWVDRDTPRVEPAALAAIYGGDRVAAVLLRELVEADPIVSANLRMRCWELLTGLGEEATLATLVEQRQVGASDPMMRDLRRVVEAFGVLPRTREEILWARRLCRPEHRPHFEAVETSLASLPPEIRGSLRMRDLAVVAATAETAPDRLTASAEVLFAALESRLADRDAGRHVADMEGYGGPEHGERLGRQRDDLDWGDLAAMHLALDALDDPSVRSALFDLAERDQIDRTTEYGGMLDLDERGRWAMVEFPPRSRGSDVRYEGPPALFEALATGVFHVHLHAQTFDNRRYAGPHLGDLQLADASGINGLVFAFVDSQTLNLDWYRHDRAVVDLGVVRRGGG